MTVSLALRNHPSIPAATRDKIRRIADLQGYRSDPVMRTLMIQMRKSKVRDYSGALAFLDAWPLHSRWRNSGPFSEIYEGCQARAESLGYRLDTIFTQERGLTGQRLSRLLRARGIRGLIIGPVPAARGHLPLAWNDFATVAIGYTLWKPDTHRVSNHTSSGIRLALRMLHRQKVRRPGLAIEHYQDARSDNQWVSGMLMHAHLQRTRSPAPPLTFAGKANRTQFLRWLGEFRPDAVLSLDLTIYSWLIEEGIRVPKDVRFVHLNWLPSYRTTDDCTVTGLNLHPRENGERAIELVATLVERNEIGLPALPSHVLLPPSWVDGAT